MLPKRSLNRLHPDLYSADYEADVARLRALGATRPDWNYLPDADFVVLADPDGNEFCVIDTTRGRTSPAWAVLTLP